VIVHASAEVVCKADVQDNSCKSGEDVAATLFRDKALSASLEGFAMCRLRDKLADCSYFHLSLCRDFVKCFRHLLTDNAKRARVETTRLTASLPPIGVTNTRVVTIDILEAILQQLLHRWHGEVSAILQLHEKWNRESTEEFNSTVLVERLGIAIIEVRTDGFPVVQKNTLLLVRILDDADRCLQ